VVEGACVECDFRAQIEGEPVSWASEGFGGRHGAETLVMVDELSYLGTGIPN